MGLSEYIETYYATNYFAHIPIVPKDIIRSPKTHDFDYTIVIGPSGKDSTYKTTIYEIKFPFEIKLEHITIQLTMFQNMQKEFHPFHDDIVCNIGKISIWNDKRTLEIEVDSFRVSQKGWLKDYLGFMRVSVHEQDVPILRPTKAHQ